MSLIIRVKLDDPGPEWADDVQRARLIREQVEAVTLDAAVEATGWAGEVSSYYVHPDG